MFIFASQMDQLVRLFGRVRIDTHEIIEEEITDIIQLAVRIPCPDPLMGFEAPQTCRPQLKTPRGPSTRPKKKRKCKRFAGSKNKKKGNKNIARRQSKRLKAKQRRAEIRKRGAEKRKALLLRKLEKRAQMRKNMRKPKV